MPCFLNRSKCFQCLTLSSIICNWLGLVHHRSEMTRKKKQQPQQQKRHQVTDSSGWTHIIKGPTSPVTSDRHLPPERINPSLTLEAYAELFQMRYIPQWQDSSCFRSLARVLEEGVLAADHLTLCRCICLGLGSLTAGTTASSYELATLISILEILSTHPSREPNCLATSIQCRFVYVTLIAM